MPGMNGFEFANKVLEINPLTKILLMTALGARDIDWHILSALKINAFVQKPMSRRQLTEMIGKYINKALLRLP